MTKALRELHGSFIEAGTSDGEGTESFTTSQPLVVELNSPHQDDDLIISTLNGLRMLVNKIY